MAEIRERELTPEEVQASIARTNAEAVKFLAEAKKANAEASNSSLQAKSSQIQLEQMEDKRANELAEDSNNFILNFTSDVTRGAVREAMDQINRWRRQYVADKFEVCFSSPGGDVVAGMAFYDYLQQCRRDGWYVTTSALGLAASMAGILLQAGDWRVMGREAFILIHEVSFEAGGKIGEVEDEVALAKKMQERVLSIFSERSGMTKVKLRNGWRRKDWWLDSDEALSLNLVDEVR